jgi:uncharacterized membrane protein
MTPHLFIIHFPVALIVVAAGVESVGVAMADRSLREWAWRLMLIGTVATFLAFVTGEGALLAAMPRGGISPERLELHQQWGSVGTWGVLGMALLRTLWRHRPPGGFAWINLLVSVLAATLVIAISISGTLVRHGS